MTDKIEVWKWVNSALSIGREQALSLFNVLDRYPLSSFVYYYLYGRDSVALSNIKDHVHDLEHWIDDNVLDDQKLRDARLFWLITALIEIGEISLAKELIEKFDPEDLRYLLAVHAGCYLTKQLRQVEEDQKRDADSICRKLENKIEHLRRELVQEFGSALLEIRKDEITAITDGENR